MIVIGKLSDNIDYDKSYGFFGEQSKAYDTQEPFLFRCSRLACSAVLRIGLLHIRRTILTISCHIAFSSASRCMRYKGSFSIWGSYYALGCSTTKIHPIFCLPVQ